MQVERLRLTGFKSFVEPTELAIEPGLTGIVGPNGCGKSNLVEALRWVMGEGSAKRLRGDEMDDVIFAGSSRRPARNLAEVVVTLDNSARDAPFAHNESAVIEVARRITRGEGSTYRINGRDVRARDVQLLFADAATGPHSAALVSQGRVAALIAAKPAERRLVLDEAAGTTGLHARRHEAELRLKAAEANLTRVDDVIATLAVQIEALRNQARQAQRYGRLGKQIRQTESLLFAAGWQAATAEGERIAAELRDAERTVAAATETALVQERLRAEAESAMPDLRMAQAEAAAAVQRLSHAREALEQELARIVAACGETERRVQQVEADIGREAGHLADADAALSRLANERRGLELRIAAAEGARAEAAAQLDAAATALAGAETGLQQMTEACATGEARRAALERQRRDLAERHGRLQARLADSEREREPLLAAMVTPAALAEGDRAARTLSGAREGVAGGGWVERPPPAVPAALPEGVHPLAAEIGAPRALARRLEQTGWVDSEAAGWELQPHLLPGQRLVDREGRLWRWDGFARLTPASPATAEQLRQRNRLAALTSEIEQALAVSHKAAESAAGAREAREAAAAAERGAIATLRASEQPLAHARAAEANLTHRGLAAETRLAAIGETIATLGDELRELVAQVTETERALKSLPAAELARTALESARVEAAGARRREAEARAGLDRLAHEDAARQQRLAPAAPGGATLGKRPL